MKKFIVLIACLFALPAFAADAPILYSRTHIAVIRHNPPPQPQLPWQTQAPAPENPEIVLDVEVRDGMTLYHQEGWYNLSGPAGNSGIMMAFGAPAVAPITHAEQYAPLDILLVDAQGKITQIIPSIVLSQLQKDIHPAAPVMAFLFLQGGACARLSITPGDMIEYKLFQQSPTVLSAPQTAPLGAQQSPESAIPSLPPISPNPE